VIELTHFSAERRTGIQTANRTRHVTASGLLQLPAGATGYADPPRIDIFAPVFANHSDNVKGVLVQIVLLPLLVQAALSDYDNTTIQLIWRDLMPDDGNGTIMFELNSNATNVGSLYLVETLEIAQRSWQFEFHNLLVPNVATEAADGSIITALLLALIIVILSTFFFVKSR
jgi:CHASE1-domain containing sensor protein